MPLTSPAAREKPECALLSREQPSGPGHRRQWHLWQWQSRRSYIQYQGQVPRPGNRQLRHHLYDNAGLKAHTVTKTIRTHGAGQRSTRSRRFSTMGSVAMTWSSACAMAHSYTACDPVCKRRMVRDGNACGYLYTHSDPVANAKPHTHGHEHRDPTASPTGSPSATAPRQRRRAAHLHLRRRILPRHPLHRQLRKPTLPHHPLRAHHPHSDKLRSVLEVHVVRGATPKSVAAGPAGFYVGCSTAANCFSPITRTAASTGSWTPGRGAPTASLQRVIMS